MRASFISIIKRPKNIIFIVISSFLIFIILRLLPVYEILNNFFSLAGITWTRRFEIFYQYVFEPFLNTSFYEKISSVVLSILTSFNLLLFIVYAKKQRRLLSGKGLFASISGIFLGFFGVGCISCGAFILAPVITFIGLGAYTSYFIEYANIIAGVGTLLVILSSIYLLRQISKPFICE